MRAALCINKYIDLLIFAFLLGSFPKALKKKKKKNGDGKELIQGERKRSTK